MSLPIHTTGWLMRVEQRLRVAGEPLDQQGRRPPGRTPEPASPSQFLRQRQHQVEVEMRFEMRRQPVERPSPRSPRSAGRWPATPSDVRNLARKRVAAEAAVEVAAHDLARGADRAVGPSIQHGEGPGAVGTVGFAEMDFVAVECRPLGTWVPAMRVRVLSGSRWSRRPASPRPCDRARRTLQPLRIADRRPQHLVSAAQRPAPVRRAAHGP